MSRDDLILASNPRTLIHNHFKRVLDELDIITNKIVKNHLQEELLNEISLVEKCLISDIHQVIKFNINHYEMNEYKIRQKCKEIIQDQSLSNEFKIDLINEELILNDCVLIQNSGEKLGFSLIISDWHSTTNHLKFIEFLNRNRAVKEQDHIQIELDQTNLKNAIIHKMHKSFKLDARNIEFNLKCLDVSKLNIISLKNGIFNKNLRIIRIEELNLSYNSINSIDKGWFICFYRLKILNLKNCELKEVNELFFDGLNYLEILDLSFNPLKLIKNDSFKALNKLISLNLDGCKLKEITIKTFVGLLNLQTLILSNNEIEFIEKDSFNFSKNLKLLDLRKNRLRNPIKKIFDSLTDCRILIGGHSNDDEDASWVRIDIDEDDEEDVITLEEESI